MNPENQKLGARLLRALCSVTGVNTLIIGWASDDLAFSLVSLGVGCTMLAMREWVAESD